MKLIQGGLVKTITGGDIENGQILIDGGKIVAVGRGQGAFPAAVDGACPRGVRPHRLCFS